MTRIARVGLCFVVSWAAVHAAPGDVGDALAVAVDAETPAARAREARELAGRADVSLDDWLAAMRTFGRFGPAPVGATTVRVPLRVGKKTEDTEITVYVPEKYRPDRPAPLLLSLHSTGGNGRTLYYNWRGTAEKLGMLVVCPSEAGKNVGYAFSARERAATMAALRWARRRYNVDESRIFVGGFGRGAHLTWDLALRYRDRFAAMAANAGAPCLVAKKGTNNTRYLKNVVDLPIRHLQGPAGKVPKLLQTVPALFERLKGWNAIDAKLLEGERHFRSAGWPGFFGRAVRDPRPKTVRRAFARRGEGRAFWAEVLAGTGEVKVDFKLVATAEKMKALDDIGFLFFMDGEARKRTAHLQAERIDASRYVATGEQVRRFRLLLDRALLEGAGPRITVAFNGKEYRRKPKPSARVLLEEFAERFDRTFLPVVEVRIP